MTNTKLFNSYPGPRARKKQGAFGRARAHAHKLRRLADAVQFSAAERDVLMLREVAEFLEEQASDLAASRRERDRLLERLERLEGAQARELDQTLRAQDIQVVIRPHDAAEHGQHAVRIRHLPTGFEVAQGGFSSVLRNKAQALKRMCAMVEQHQAASRPAEEATQ